MKNIFQNWKSKKQLREENIRLQALLSMPPQIHTIERGAILYKCNILLKDNMSIEFAKRRIADSFAEALLNNDLIEWDINDEYISNSLMKKVTGTVYVARR